MVSRARWHDRIIIELEARLLFLRNRVSVKVNKQSSRGSDVEILINEQNRMINVEVQQFDSGAPWKSKTLPSWRQRHSFVTIIIFPEPVLERVLSKMDSVKEYAFFNEKNVFLFPDSQISEAISMIGFLVLKQS